MELAPFMHLPCLSNLSYVLFLGMCIHPWIKWQQQDEQDQAPKRGC